ncbi:MAG: DUF92 domain-containing protein [Acidobacteriota bacterium]
MTRNSLAWQSKLVLLVVLPAVATDVALKTAWWRAQAAPVAAWTLGLSVLLGLVTWQLRAATPAAALTGSVLTAGLMYSTLIYPYDPWHTALAPVLMVSLLAFVSTRWGRAQKERLGTAEKRGGRAAAQVAANLGLAALVSSELMQSWTADMHGFPRLGLGQTPLLAAGLAALAEAAADTVSSELGQVFGGQPRMITTMRRAAPGVDGAISAAGTLAGVAAAAIVSAAGMWALHGHALMFSVSCAGAVFGLLFDSLLGATLEQRGWLNNDAVNFLSTAGAATVALGLLAAVR